MRDHQPSTAPSWRAELRRGDPGAGETLAPAEAEEIRRTMLAAAGTMAARSEVPGRDATPRSARTGPYGSRRVLRAVAAAAVCALAAAGWLAFLAIGGPRGKDRAAPTAAPPPAVAAVAATTAATEPAPAGTLPRRIAAPSTAAHGRPPASSKARAATVAPPRQTAHALRSRASRSSPTVRPVPPVPQPPTPRAPAPGDRLAAISAVGAVDTASEVGAVSEVAEVGATGAVAEPPAAAPAEPMRQLQVRFSTPGGTRIIWLVREEAVRTEQTPTAAEAPAPDAGRFR